MCELMTTTSQLDIELVKAFGEFIIKPIMATILISFFIYLIFKAITD